MRRKYLIGFILLVGVAVVALLAFIFIPIGGSSPVATFPPVPNPNGYDDFLKAGQSLAGQPPAATNADIGTIESFVETNRAALDLIRLGLSRECAVPLDFSQTYLAQHMNQLTDFKKLAQLLGAVGKSAEMGGRKAEAIQCYLDSIRLGQRLARGGLVIDVMVGQACQTVGTRGLRSMRESLTGRDGTEIFQVLQAISSQSESFQTILNREKAFFRKAYVWNSVITSRLLSIVSSFKRQLTVDQTIENSVLRVQAKLRLFLVELALQIHKTENGDYPGSLAELSLTLTNGLPKDPFSGLDFIYRRETTGYLLYSIGADRKDDGGKAMNRQAAAGIPPGDILPD
jgi:hypothetical protein